MVQGDITPPLNETSVGREIPHSSALCGPCPALGMGLHTLALCEEVYCGGVLFSAVTPIVGEFCSYCGAVTPIVVHVHFSSLCVYLN